MAGYDVVLAGQYQHGTVVHGRARVRPDDGSAGEAHALRCRREPRVAFGGDVDACARGVVEVHIGLGDVRSADHRQPAAVGRSQHPRRRHDDVRTRRPVGRIGHDRDAVVTGVDDRRRDNLSTVGPHRHVDSVRAGVAHRHMIEDEARRAAHVHPGGRGIADGDVAQRDAAVPDQPHAHLLP